MSQRHHLNRAPGKQLSGLSLDHRLSALYGEQRGGSTAAARRSRPRAKPKIL
jgi:hypothetical protein